MEADRRRQWGQEWYFWGRSLLNWRTKLRRYMARKLKEQAKALDIR